MIDINLIIIYILLYIKSIIVFVILINIFSIIRIKMLYKYFDYMVLY